MSFDSRANREQLQAIQSTEGPLLIIAGPGSGKTFTLVERIVYLINKKGAAPESFFVVTFINKAAGRTLSWFRLALPLARLEGENPVEYESIHIMPGQGGKWVSLIVSASYQFDL